MRCVWFGFEMTPSTDRTTVLYCTTYSRLYYTIIHYTGLCRQSSTTRVFGLLNLKDEYCAVVVTYRSSRKTETQPRWRWFLYV
ncbi:unnamed protein product [Ascophyllum nodosum]